MQTRAGQLSVEACIRSGSYVVTIRFSTHQSMQIALDFFTACICFFKSDLLSLFTLCLRMKSFLFYIYICGLCLFWGSLPSTVRAQQDFRVQHFSETDGISQGIVQNIIQDESGYIWISTWNGLNKYDGYKFRVFKSRVGDGNPLFNNRIVNIRQSSSGNIWCRTLDDKIYLFDVQEERFIDVLADLEKKLGRQFKIKRIIPLTQSVTWLACDKNECIRIDETCLDKSEGICLYDWQTPDWRVGRVWKIYADRDGDEWVMTDKGTNLVGEKQIRNDIPFRHIVEFEQYNLLVADDGRIARYDGEELHFMKSVADVGKVNNVKVFSDSLLVLGCDNGLWFYDLDTEVVEYVDIRSAEQPSSVVSSIMRDSKDRLWILTQTPGAVCVWSDSRQVKFYPAPKQVTKRMADKQDHSFVSEDAYGVIRVKHRSGALAYYDEEADELRPYLNADGSVYDPVMRFLLIDRQDNIWYASERDLYCVSFFYLNYKSYKNPNNVEVRCLYVDRQKRIWEGWRDGCLVVYDSLRRSPRYMDTTGRLVRQPTRFFGNVYAVLEDSKGNYWIGTRGQGLVLAQPVAGDSDRYVLKRFEHHSDDLYSISGNNIYSICEDTNHHIWVGVFEGGINLLVSQDGNYRFVHGGNRMRHYPVDYKTSRIRSINECNGVILAGSSEGFYTFNSSFKSPDDIQFYLHTRQDQPHSLNCNEVMSIYVDSRKHVYLATFTGGINKLRPGNWLSNDLQFDTYDCMNGMLSELALSTVEDRSGYIWFVMENYLVRYDSSTGRMEHYGLSFFHRRMHFSETLPVCGSNGHLYFSILSDEVLDIDPEHLNQSDYMPPLVFSGLNILNDSTSYYSLAGRNSVTLQPEQRNVTFLFSALDYVDIQSIQYAYRLRGLDDGWHYCGNEHSANYNNLPPGDYVFEVRSTNNEGRWNEKIISFDVHIVPTFWETPWAWLVYGVILIGFIALVIYILFYIYKLRYKISMEQQLLEIKLHFLTDMSHELRTPLTLISGPVDEVLKRDKTLAPLSRKHLEMVQRNTKRMLRLINQLLDFRKIQSHKMKLMVEHVNLTDLFGRVADNFTLLAQERRIDYQYIHEPSFVWGWVDRDKFEKICYNIVGNAFKYTPEGHSITLRIQEKETEIGIFVSDTGIGIEADRLPRIFHYFEGLSISSPIQPSSGIGLALVKKLVEMHHGRIEVTSKKGEGTVFMLYFPKDRAVLEQDEQVEFVSTNDMASDAMSVETQSTAKTNAINEHLKVLVVEDNDELRAYLYNILSSDYQVTLVSDGLQGLNSVRHQMPDLIVSDVVMPVMDGIEMVRHLKQQTNTCHTPLFYCRQNRR